MKNPGNVKIPGVLMISTRDWRPLNSHDFFGDRRALPVIRQSLNGDAVIRAAVRHFSRISLSFSASSSGVSRRPFSIQRV